jgi:dihydropteroate synthase
LRQARGMLTLESLARLFEKYREAAHAQVSEFSLGGKLFAFNSRPAIMGVVNLSPDSWYRESVCLSAQQAIQRGRILAEQGAQVIDVGAESTLAHAARLDERGQAAKLLPVLEGLRQSGILASVETYSASVAQEVLEAGANVLNLTGTEGTERIYKMVAERQAAVIICYVQGKNVREVSDYTFADDPVSAMRDYFARAIDVARGNGVERILIDPGLGFYYRNLQDGGTRVRLQMRVFLNSFRLRSLGCPICQALPHAFEYFGDEVRSAEGFFAVLAALGKADLFRTHEVPRIKAVLETLAQYEL